MQSSFAATRFVRLVFVVLLGLMPVVSAYAAPPSVEGAASAQADDAFVGAARHAPRPPAAAAQRPAAQLTPTITYTGTASARRVMIDFADDDTSPRKPRTAHTATVLSDTTVLIVGGERASLDGELYDPATQTYTETSGFGGYRLNHTATLLPDGDVLVVGGGSDAGYYAIATVVQYNPATRFVRTRETLQEPRINHTATLLPDGSVLVAGGRYNDTSALGSTERLDPGTGQWKGAGRMRQGRWGHTATLLPNGNVLVAGGYTYQNNRTLPLATTEIYDPATNTFTRSADMQQARAVHTATVLPDGTVLFVGGGAAEIYDPATNTFTRKTMTEPQRRYHTATVLPDGRVLIVGGLATSALGSAEIYDPATGTFSTTGTLLEARYDHTASLLADGTVLILDGTINRSASASAEVYDPATGTFSTRGTTTQARQFHTATHLEDDTVLIAGGNLRDMTPLASAVRYDPATRRYTDTGSLLQARTNHTETLLPDGTVLIAGGDPGDPALAFASVEVYDPATGTFTTTGSMRTARTNHTATLLPDGTVLVAGGFNDTWLTSAEIYDPATGTFTPTGSMAQARQRHTATALLDGRVLVAGGIANNVSIRRAEVYDPASGTFSATGSLLRARSRHDALRLPDGTVLVTGGTGSTERYDPATGAFTNVPTLNRGTIDQTSTLFPDGRVLIAGGTNGSYDDGLARLYDPVAQSIVQDDIPLEQTRGAHTATLLDDGSVLLWGGRYTTRPESARYVSNTFTGTLTLPRGWIGATTPLSITGTSSGAPLVSASVTYGGGVALTAGTVATITLQYIPEGRDRTFEMRLTDRNQVTATVLTVTADVDLNAPTSYMNSLPVDSPRRFDLSWAGADATSGVEGYDVQARDNNGAWTPVVTNTATLTTTFEGRAGHRYEFRVRARDRAGNVEAWPRDADASTTVDFGPPTSTLVGLPEYSDATFALRWSGMDEISTIRGYDLEVRDNGGAWTPVLTNTLALSTTFTGEHAHTYRFRLRATDDAGNVEGWTNPFDTETTVDTVKPTGTFTINGGARATTTEAVTLLLAPLDAPSGVDDVRVALDGTPGQWQPYQPSLPVTLVAPDGDTVVGVEFRDRVGNVSDTITRTIRIDRSADRNPALLIDDGAIYTNVPTVTLTIGAPPNTAAMQISNNGTFAGDWLPFDTTAIWTLTTYGDEPLTRNVYVRTRDIDGDVQDTAIDDIVYDPLPPEGSVTITSVTASAVEVRVDASDNDSRKDQLRMRLSTDPQFSGASWQPYAATANVARTGTDAVRVYAQFEDAAGNRSDVGCTAQNGGSCAISGGFDVFLPLVRR